MNKKTLIITLCIATLMVALSVPEVFAAASFSVSNLACSPSESKVGSTFSCTATVRNAGDAAGTVGTVTLYPDVANWLESSNYPKTVSQSVSSGESVDATFNGLKAVKSGSNKFSEVRIDDASDTSSTVTGITVNSIDVVVSLANSKSSAAMDGTWTATTEVTAGGSIDVLLTLSITSGGCTIGNQDSQKTISGMQHGSKQSRSWTITMGSSGDCMYTISAAATGTGGVATKTDSTKSSITCSDCPTGGGSASTSTGSGGGGGGGSSAAVSALQGSVTYELGRDEIIRFSLASENHSVQVLNFTPTSVELEVRSEPQRVTLVLGEEKEIDLNADGKGDLRIKLQSVNVLTNKVKLILTSLVVPSPSEGKKGSSPGKDAQSPGTANEETTAGQEIVNALTSPVVRKSFFWLLLVGVVLFVGYLVWHHHVAPERRLRKLAERVTWHAKKGLQ